MRSIVYHQAAGRCTLARDEIQGRLAALDDIHHASRGDDMPSLREPPKLGKLASGNPYCGLDKKILVPKNEDFLCYYYKIDPYKAVVQKQSMLFAVRVDLSLGDDGSSP